jgi:hypothetical protein
MILYTSKIHFTFNALIRFKFKSITPLFSFNLGNGIKQLGSGTIRSFF